LYESPLQAAETTAMEQRSIRGVFTRVPMYILPKRIELLFIAKCDKTLHQKGDFS